MFKNNKHLLFTALLLLLAIVHGCGAGISKTVEAAEISGSPLAIHMVAESSAPTLQTGAGLVSASGMIGQAVDVQLQASGGQGSYTWSVVNGSLPTGLTLNSKGTILGTFATAGTWTTTLQLSDGGKPAQTAQQQVAFQVTSSKPLAISTTSLAAASVGQVYSATLQATGGTPAYKWSLTAGSLPAGLALGSNGVLGGTPLKAGTFTFSVTAQDSSSPAQSKKASLSLTVGASVSITSTTLGNAQKGLGYSATLQATGGSGKYAWIANLGLPTGLQLSLNGVLSGTPTVTGTNNITVTAFDMNAPTQHATAVIPLTVTAAVTPLSITTSSLSGATTGAAYSSTLSATGGTPGYTWTAPAGGLPSGLSLSSTGVLSGTPTASGPATFVVVATDSATPAQQTSKSLTVSVASSPLTITTGLFASAQNAVSYAAQLSAVGGTPGYTWSITTGSLPSGLSLQATTGAITGTPSNSTSSTFTYTVADNSNPQQKVSATATIQVSAAPAASAGNIWFIRPDGGTRYSAGVPNGQCDGRADAAYPGSGVNQHCAYNDARYLWMDGTYGNYAWVGSSGDTYVIRGCAATAGQQNADAPHCRIGWDTATGSYASGNIWCQGSNYCQMPPPPNGTATQHTRVLGGCAYDGNCKPVVGWPYTGSNLTQIFAGFMSSTAASLWNASYIDYQGLEITTHNGKCARYGTTNPLPSCVRGVSESTSGVSDQADAAFTTSNQTHDITLTDIYIHGFSSSGIQGPIGGKMTLNRVNLSFNAFAGWNFDDGVPTPDAAGSSITQSYVTMVGNGCQEEYPITHPQFPAAGCWDTQNGGFGDSWSGQQSSMDSFTCDHCYIAYNTKDGAMGPHTQIGSISLTNSMWVGNMGQAAKWGQQNNATFLFENNIVVGNCERMSQLLPGAARTFDSSSSSQAGAGLSGYCRAAGALFAYFAGANSTVNISNNTVVTYQPTIFQMSCYSTGTCGTSPYKFTNNIVLGYTTTYNFSPFNPGTAPAAYYTDDGTISIVGSHNLQYGVRKGDTCGTNGNLCSDPLLVNEPGQGSFSAEAVLDNLNFHLTSGSPAIGSGISNALSPLLDFYGNLQSATNLGAVAP